MITKISCSGLARPMQCAGSLFFKDLPKSPSHPVAEEGTAFGELVEAKLKGGPIPSHGSNGVAFDGDMEFYSQSIVDEINSDRQSDVLCEVRIDWSTRAGVYIKGRYDASFVRDSKLYVDDVKYGWGVVEPEENWQLLSYAIGEVMRRGIAFQEIVMRIHQPRAYHHAGSTREWRVSYDQLLSYKDQIESRMQKITDGYKDLTTGSQCKYCPAATVCPAFNKTYFRGVETVHEFLQDNISDAELAFQLDLYDRLSEVFKTRKFSLEQLAVDRINKGGVIPSYAVTQSYTNRKWKSGIDSEFVKMMTGKDTNKVEMLSPAQAEKAGVPKKFIAKLTERHLKGAKLERTDTGKLADKIFGDPNA